MQKWKTIWMSLLVMALWGSLFPCVKIGYSTWGIDASSVPDILMFAAVRFVLCGGLLCLFAVSRRKTIPLPAAKSIGGMIWVGVFAIVLHYACSYIGLSTTDSSKTALLKQSGVLIYVCFSFLFFQDEKFSIYKIVGAIIGFLGIAAINVSKTSWSFSFGDILILSASLCTVVSNVISKKSVQNSAPVWITGISQLFGGLVLLATSLALGGRIPQISPEGFLVFGYICTASIASYILWYRVQKSDALSKLFIIKFAEPLFACVFGAVLLGENIFKVQYLAAFILVSAGIMLGAVKKEKI